MPAVTVWMVAAYALFLLGVAWGIDHLGRRSSERSATWRTGNFVYHDDHDAWKCHEDQWLWPAAFDPEKRVIRYQGQHAICGRCPVKATCSPSPGPREITRQLDPWPFSEAGRFQRGLALLVAVIAVFLPLGMLLARHRPLELVVLGTTVVVVVAAGIYPLGRHLWNTPANFPEHLPVEGMEETAQTTTSISPSNNPSTRDPRAEAAALVDRYSTRWASDRNRGPGKV